MSSILQSIRFLRFFLLLLFTGHAIVGVAQVQKDILKDSIDQKLDVSKYLTELHGFLPVPAIVSEPAIGNFGLVLAAVFIAPQKSETNKDRFHFPDITAGFGMYTANQSWVAGIFRMGSFPKLGLRYRVGGMYGQINLNFYRTLAYVGEQEFKFNFTMKAALLELSKSIYRNRIFLGLSYVYANSSIAYRNLILPPGTFADDDFESQVGNLGFFTDIDYRDNTFTANKGVRIKTTYSFNRDFTGSDYNYDRLELFAHLFLKPAKRLVSGFRAEGMAITGDVPFYAYPFVYIRGIPMMRYQGQQTLLFETEQRFDFSFRWSMVAFAGTGKAYKTQNFKDVQENWNWAGGLGFRYLIARVFGMRVGVDIARGPENFAYYVVFGHAWNR